MRKFKVAAEWAAAALGLGTFIIILQLLLTLITQLRNTM